MLALIVSAFFITVVVAMALGEKGSKFLYCYSQYNDVIILLGEQK
jgi:hypothetical protein